MHTRSPRIGSTVKFPRAQRSPPKIQNGSFTDVKWFIQSCQILEIIIYQSCFCLFWFSLTINHLYIISSSISADRGYVRDGNDRLSFTCNPDNDNEPDTWTSEWNIVEIEHLTNQAGHGYVVNVEFVTGKPGDYSKYSTKSYFYFYILYFYWYYQRNCLMARLIKME